MQIEEIVYNLKNQMEIDKDFFFNHPEKGLEEFKTQEYIVKRLKEIGFKDEEINTNIYETAVVANLNKEKDGPCILFRCEMDAVVMDDGVPKHTCGHHAHMAIMLAIATILFSKKDELNGKVKFVFEPDEEGNGGAEKLIENGVLENPRVDKVFAVHVWSELKEGTISVKEGAVMASTDPFNVVIKGKGGHAAIPEKCVDPIVAASYFIQEIKKLSNINGIEISNKVVTGITAVNGGKTNNVIPEEVYLKGICRTFSNEAREVVMSKIKNIIEEISKKCNVQIDLKYILNYLPTINDTEEAKVISKISTEIVDNVDNSYVTMCAEDFSYFLKEKPGAYIFIGNTINEYYPQHNENFTVGINPVLIGTELFYKIVKKYLTLNDNDSLKS